VNIFECPREISARVTSGLHRNKVLKVKAGRGGYDDSYRGCTMTNWWLNDGAWTTRAWLQWMEMKCVATSLPSALAGLAVTRRGGPNLVVFGRKCDGGRRRTTADGGGQWEMLFDSVG